MDAGYLKHVYLVFERLGFERRNDSDWDVLWAHMYPFRVLYSSLRSLKPHQKVRTLLAWLWFLFLCVLFMPVLSIAKVIEHQ